MSGFPSLVMSASSNTFEIKGASVPLLTLHLRSGNLDAAVCHVAEGVETEEQLKLLRELG